MSALTYSTPRTISGNRARRVAHFAFPLYQHAQEKGDPVADHLERAIDLLVAGLPINLEEAPYVAALVTLYEQEPRR